MPLGPWKTTSPPGLVFSSHLVGINSAHLVVSSLELKKKKSSQERADLAQPAGLWSGCLPGLGPGPGVQGGASPPPGRCPPAPQLLP